MLQPYQLKLKLSGKDRSRLTLAGSGVMRSLLAAFYLLIINHLLLRAGQPDTINAFVLSMSVVNALVIIPNWGGKEYVIKTLSAQPRLIKNNTGILLGSRLMLALPLIVGVLIFPLPAIQRLFIVFMVLFRTFSNLCEGLITHQKKQTVFLIADLLFYSLITSLFFLNDSSAGPGAFLWILISAELLRVLFLIWHFRKNTTVNIRPKILFKSLNASSTFFFMSLAGFISSRADLYVVGVFMPQSDMNKYYILLGMTSLAQVIYSSFVGSFASGILRSGKGAFSRFARDWSFHGMIYAMAMAGCIYTVSEGWYDLSLPLILYPFTAINLFLFSLTLTCYYGATRSGHQNLVLKAIVFAAIANLGFAVLLVPTLGTGGAFISNTIALLVMYLFMKKAAFNTPSPFKHTLE